MGIRRAFKKLGKKKTWKRAGKKLGKGLKAAIRPAERALSRVDRELGVVSDLTRGIPGLHQVVGAAGRGLDVLRVGDHLIQGDLKGAGRELGRAAIAEVKGAIPGVNTITYAADKLGRRRQATQLSGQQQTQQSDLVGEGSGIGESPVGQAMERTGGGVSLHRPFQGVAAAARAVNTRRTDQEPKIGSRPRGIRRRQTNARSVGRAARNMADRLEAVRGMAPQ